MTARVKLDIDATRDKLAALGLGYAVDALEGLLAEAVRAETPAHVFLDGLLDAERSGREERRIKTMLKTAKIPTGQTLENFDFAFQPAPVNRARGRASRPSPPAALRALSRSKQPTGLFRPGKPGPLVKGSATPR